MSGFLLIEGPLNQIIVRPGEKAALSGDPMNIELLLDEALEGETTMYILPLYWSPAFHRDTDLGTDLDDFIYLILYRKNIGATPIADGDAPTLH